MTVGGPESRVEERELGCVQFSRTVCLSSTDWNSSSTEAASLSSTYRRRRQRLSTAFSRARSAAECVSWESMTGTNSGQCVLWCMCWHREAVCLSRVRLSPSDPVLHKLFTSWAAHLSKDGNYELAAKWYCYYWLAL